MSSIADVLKLEITRLARKEARAMTKSLHRAVAQFRRDIAELKRQNSSSRASIVRLERQVRKRAAVPIAEAPVDNIRFSAASVKAQRKRLGISAADFGTLIGVTGHTIYEWEHGTSRPRKALVAAFAAVRSLGKREAKERLEQLRAKTPKGRKKRGQR